MKMLIILTMTMFIFLMSNFFIQESSSGEMSSNSPFECGFESIFSLRVPFSIHFFSIIMIFLIFDLEVVIILPIIRLMESEIFLFIVFSVMMMILILGLLMEWNEGTLEWSV